MNRREVLSAIGLLLGGALVGGDLLAYPSSDSKIKLKFLDQNQISFLDEVADTILPTTDSPGAKAAQVGSFMARIVQDCYTPKEQQVFLKGIDTLKKVSQEKYGKDFMALNNTQRTALLIAIDKEHRDYMRQRKQGDPTHYFRMMKELTLFGYFTSEVGATQALRYLPIPGKYDGCMPYKKGDKAWAT